MMITRATETAITYGALAAATLGLGAVIVAAWRRPRGARALEIGGGIGIERGDETVVVNESDRELQIVTYVYGDDVNPLLGGSTQVVRRGGMATCDHRLTHIGPDDEPPGSVTISKRTDASTQYRYWLTWDPAR